MPPKSLVAIPRRYSLDYAPTGRASCKKCGCLIHQYTARFCRKVQSPWHDGYDLQYYHLECGITFLDKQPDKVYDVGILSWDDFLEAADLMNKNVKMQDPKVQTLQKTLKAVHEARQMILDAKIPLNVLTQILDANQFPQASSLKLKGPAMAHIIADQILRGKLIACPVCQTHALLPSGFEVSCRGWVDDNTHCDFGYSWCPVMPLASSYVDRISPLVAKSLKHRQEDYIIPTSLGGPLWKNLNGLLSSLDDSLFRSRLVRKVIETKEKVKTKRIDPRQLKSDKLLTGLAIGSAGSLETVKKQELEGWVNEMGGLWIKDVSKISSLRSGSRAVCLVSLQNWSITRTQEKVKGALSAGVVFLREEFIINIRKPVDDKDCLSKKKSELKTRPEELPVGPILRQAQYMYYYVVDGGKPFDAIVLESDDEKENDGGIIPQPRIRRESALMKVDLDAFDEDTQMSLTSNPHAIFVDRFNHAFSVNLTNVDLSSGRNSFYNIQLVMEFLGPKKKRLKVETGDSPSPPLKKAKREDDKSLFESERSLVETEKSSYPHQTSTYIDNTQMSEKEWASYINSQRCRYYLVKKWGRFGREVDGRMNNSQNEDYMQNLDAAINDFCVKYKDLTKIDFYQRYVKSPIPGTYKLMELEGYDYPSHVPPSRKSEGPGPTPVKVKHEPGELTGKIRNILELITDSDAMSASLQTMNINVKQFDLESLSIRQLHGGYTILSEIEQLLKSKSHGDRLAEARYNLKLKGLTTKFYTLLPVVFERQSIPPVIDTIMAVQKQCDLLSDVIGTAESVKIVGDYQKEDSSDFIELYYSSLSCQLDYVSPDVPMYAKIKEMIQMGHGTSHNSFTMELLNVFSITPRQVSSYMTNLDNKCLLWHGSRMSNWTGILKNGLKIAPPEAPSSGYMFGKGIYFADLASKSALYCQLGNGATTARGVMLLCEVALGTSYVTTHADEKAHQVVIDEGCQSTWGQGQIKLSQEVWVKSAQTNHVFESTSSHDYNVKVPCGSQTQQETDENAKIRNQHRNTSPLMYNEFVVYDINQIYPRYLVEVEFQYRSFLELESDDSSSSDSEDSSDESECSEVV